MQISTLIFSPAFIQGGLYVLLGRIIPVLGSRYSFIHPLSYTIVFVTGDMISLVIQAVGGGNAAAAETNEQADQGARVMGALTFSSCGTMSSSDLIWPPFPILSAYQSAVSLSNSSS